MERRKIIEEILEVNMNLLDAVKDNDIERVKKFRILLDNLLDIYEKFK